MNEGNKNYLQVSRPSTRALFRRIGFTLIEMLVVISLIALLLAIAAPAVFNGLQATKLSGAGERMLGALSEAQQIAYSRNYPVEMRFYKFQGPFPDSEAFRGYQLFRISTPAGTNTEVTTKISESTKLPDGVMISVAEELSKILSGEAIADPPNAAGLTNSGIVGAKYIALRFMTDGTCRKVGASAQGLATLTVPPPPDCFLTLVEDDGKTYGGNSIPKNFFTIQIDPWTGKSRSYRPGF